MVRSSPYIIAIALSLLISSCDNERVDDSLFDILDNTAIGIDFINELTYDRDFNVYKYRNYYNGGGVALGDINNDGWTDIYFTANLLSNRLYLNNGDGTYTDVTDSAGVGGTKSWSTGVTMVDINADGFLDIYVCNSGDIKGGNKENELFINNGDLSFTDKAAEYGLNDTGYSTHASFFDYDKDGDLDAYILNNSYQAIGSFNLRTNERPKRDKEGGDKLLRNDQGVFVDVSEQAGIYGSVIGFGLGITVGDVNNDYWEDIYVSNDFFERDYLYINNQDGTFDEVLAESIGSISGASMGADMADVDNDGYSDIFVTEMLPSDPQRLKSVTTFEDWNKYQYNLKNGYHHQFTRNTLQYNNGDGTFSELGRFAGVEASDWSWGALFFDMDNDGLKDLFVANGIYQDLTNQDYLQYIANEQVIKSIISDQGVNYKELIDIIPSNPIANHFYLNKGQLAFDRIRSASMDIPSFSNGSAYGDLDNDGDLDLVINNVNMPPIIYKNLANQKNNYISLKLQQQGKNINAVGATIKVYSGDSIMITLQVQPARGFQSSVDPRINIGLGVVDHVDIEVVWPDMSQTYLENHSVNSDIIIHKENTTTQSVNQQSSDDNHLFTTEDFINFDHQENDFSDFNRERLIYHMMSNRSPRIASGELDGDGQADYVIAAAKGSLSAVFLSTEDYRPKAISNKSDFRDQEHTDVLIFDANGDTYQDIYLASGGVDVSPFSPVLYDQLWFGNGEGDFELSPQRIPNNTANISTSVVVGSDFDQDGDIDLFLGERVKIGQYGAPCSGYILQNDGTGVFEDKTEGLAIDLQGIGMITDAAFADVNGDGAEELLVVGEFMTLSIFQWKEDHFESIDYDSKDKLYGWYHTIHVVDLDQDGYKDILLGNHGLNSRFKATQDEPIKLYFNDFDQNGFAEGILTYVGKDGLDHPYALRHNLIDQLKYLKKRFPDFKAYQDAPMDVIFTADEMSDVSISIATDLSTKALLNQGDFKFSNLDLPKEVQFTPIYAIESGDFDKDGDTDIIMGGNQFGSLPESGIYDASKGVYLENIDNNIWRYVPPAQSGLLIPGQVRDILISGDSVIVARNDDALLSFKY